MANPKTRAGRPRPDLSYSSGFSKNVEWLIGPWFVILGSFLAIETLVLHPQLQVPHQTAPPSPTFVIAFPVIGLIFCYFAFFQRTSRLEVTGKTLYWFLPFHRVKGQAAIADVVIIWTEATLQWNLTRTAIRLTDGRTVRVRDRTEIRAFVAALVAQSPGIDTTEWEPRVPPAPQSTTYLNDKNDNSRGVIERN